MKYPIQSVLILLLFGLIASGCTLTLTPEAPSMANPASVHCEEEGGALDIRTGENGGQVGYCQFEDGSECEEWAFFRGECAPGGAK